MKKLILLAAVGSLFTAIHANAVTYTFDFTNDGTVGSYSNPDTIWDETGTISLGVSALPQGSTILYGLAGLGISNGLFDVEIDEYYGEMLNFDFSENFLIKSIGFALASSSDQASISVGAWNWTGTPGGFPTYTGSVDINQVGSSVGISPVNDGYIGLYGIDAFSVTNITVESLEKETRNSVPDSGASLALFGIAIAGLFSIRKRFKN